MLHNLKLNFAIASTVLGAGSLIQQAAVYTAALAVLSCFYLASCYLHYLDDASGALAALCGAAFCFALMLRAYFDILNSYRAELFERLCQRCESCDDALPLGHSYRLCRACVSAYAL